LFSVQNPTVAAPHDEVMTSVMSQCI